MLASHHSALDASVLVLNKLFMAVHIIPVRRAFCLLCKDLAEVVSLEDGQFATYDFTTWLEVSEYRSRHFRQEDDDWVRTSSTECLESILGLGVKVSLALVSGTNVRDPWPNSRLMSKRTPAGKCTSPVTKYGPDEAATLTVEVRT